MFEIKNGIFIFVILILTACSNRVEPEPQSIDYDLSEYYSIIDFDASPDSVVKHFALERLENGYKKSKKNKAFAQSESGAWASRSGYREPWLAIEAAYSSCQNRNKGFRTTKPCKIINIDGVWGRDLNKIK